MVEVVTFKRMIRCQAVYPEPALTFRKWVTVGTFLSQYAVPLVVTFIAYCCVSRRVWWRSVLGAATKQQVHLHVKAKRKTVKMLMVVVLVFAICWLPLNTYHLIADLKSGTGPSRHSTTLFFLCHWFAMSSVCYNPFIYSWLNDHFKAGAKEWLSCFARKVCRIKSNSAFEMDYEQNMPPFFKLKDSVTGSSSTYGGSVGCTIKSGSRSDSMRSKTSTFSQVQNAAVSEIHVPLDEVMDTPAGRNFQKQTNVPRKISKKKSSFRASSTSVSSANSSTKTYSIAPLQSSHDETIRFHSSEDKPHYSTMPFYEIQLLKGNINSEKAYSCRLCKCFHHRKPDWFCETDLNDGKKICSCGCHHYCELAYSPYLKSKRAHPYRSRIKRESKVSLVINAEPHSKLDRNYSIKSSSPVKLCNCTMEQQFIQFAKPENEDKKQRDSTNHLKSFFQKNESSNSLMKYASILPKKHVRTSSSTKPHIRCSKFIRTSDSRSLPSLHTSIHKDIQMKRKPRHIFSRKVSHSLLDLSIPPPGSSKGASSTKWFKKESNSCKDIYLFTPPTRSNWLGTKKKQASKNKLSQISLFESEVYKSRSVDDMTKFSLLKERQKFIRCHRRSSSTPLNYQI